MADTRLPVVPEVTALDAADLIYAVDVSDTTDHASGSSARITSVNLLANTIVICVWTGAVWQTANGGSVPTTATLIREFRSLNDAAATAPTYYNDNDIWHKAI